METGMKLTHATAFVAIAASIVIALPIGGRAEQGQQTPDQVVAAVKKNLQEGQAKLRTYEWVETTSISLKGEEKSRKQQRAYYGADGKVTKTPIGEPPAPAAAPAGRGGRLKNKVVENKKDEMKEYMERAAALIHSYVPPSPDLIQKSKDAGNLKVSPLAAGQVRAAFANFLQPSDLLSIDVDAAAGRLSAVTVATYLDKREDAVTLAVQYSTLADGASFVAQTTLDATAKNLRVVVLNSGHRPLVR
jgi:hypothetical protein